MHVYYLQSAQIVSLTFAFATFRSVRRLLKSPEAHPYRQRQPALESRAWLLPKSLLVDPPCLEKACLLTASLRDSSVYIQGYSAGPAEAWKSFFTTSKKIPCFDLPVVQYRHLGHRHSEQARQISCLLRP